MLLTISCLCKILGACILLRHCLRLGSLEAKPESGILFKGNENCWEVLSAEGKWEVGSGGGRSQGCGLSRNPVSPVPSGAPSRGCTWSWPLWGQQSLAVAEVGRGQPPELGSCEPLTADAHNSLERGSSGAHSLHGTHPLTWALLG